MNDYKCKSISWNASGAEIEAESFRRIEAEIAPEVRCRFSPGEWRVVRRLIHTTADFAIADVVGFKNDPVSAGLAALRNGAGIYSDSNMIKAGLSVSKLSSFNSNYSRDSIICPSLNAPVGELARQRHITRALAGVEIYLDKIDNGIFLCGNAPLALAGVAEAVLTGRIKPRLIIAMPVGFVNVVESKELALQLNDVPMIILNGRRGGSPLAVAALHGIMESGEELQ